MVLRVRLHYSSPMTTSPKPTATPATVAANRLNRLVTEHNTPVYTSESKGA